MKNILRRVDISSYSAFKTPAIAEYFIEISSESDITELISTYKEFQKKNLPIIILGSGTNCLFAFDVFPGLVISIKIRGITPLDESKFWISASELVSPLSMQYTKNNITNALIPWIGLPGTIGGAIVGNAGCFGLETKDILLNVKVVDLDTGEVQLIPNTKLEYTYRNSYLKTHRNLLVLGGIFDLSPRNDNPYASTGIIDMLAIRREKQPTGLSCGSFYMNPVGHSAGKLIDDAGCKGMRVGGIRVSEIHGNFFIADSGVIYQDVLTLSEKVKEAVYLKSGIELKEEVRKIAIL